MIDIRYNIRTHRNLLTDIIARVHVKIGVSWIAPPLKLFTDIYGNIKITADIPVSIAVDEQELLVTVYEELLSTAVEIVE